MKLSLLLLASAAVVSGGWTEPVHVRHELKPCISYRAKLAGEYLIVEATLDEGWHTFAMDNQKRADDKLAGKKALGIDRETSIQLNNGLSATGGWLQSAPKDFSKPELRWFSWGFEKKAYFAAKVKPAGAGPAQLTIKGQACTESVCKNIDVELTVPVKADPEDAAVKSLTPVR
ncbi:MAG: hypothetical protein IT168_25680 [Bryobacterales bacterium]|nr:hypothetical protein [Bryobacterales bacterium]